MSELDATFKPFEKNLNLNKTLDFLKTAINKADDGELFLERSQNENFLFDDRKLKQSSFSSKEGFGIRAVKGERTAFSHSSEININKIKNAVDSISLKNKESDLINKNYNTLNNDVKRVYSNENPFHNIDLSNKLKLLKKIDEYARQTEKNIQQVSVSLNASLQEVFILRAEENILNDIRPMVRIYVSVIIEENGKRESGSSGGGGRFNISEIMNEKIWKNHVDEALRLAKVNLRAKPAPAGVMDIVLGSGWPGVMLHEAVGHGLEGDFNRKETSAFSNLIGKKVASENVTVIDDGTIPDRRGSITYDDDVARDHVVTVQKAFDGSGAIGDLGIFPGLYGISGAGANNAGVPTVATSGNSVVNVTSTANSATAPTTAAASPVTSYTMGAASVRATVSEASDDAGVAGSDDEHMEISLVLSF